MGKWVNKDVNLFGDIEILRKMTLNFIKYLKNNP